MTEQAKAKVFCIGFQKTGTSSMRDALQHLGYRVADYFGTDLPFEELRECYVDKGLEILQQYDSVQDMPWPLMYRELDEAYPGSKFIYTERDPANWLRSMVKHFGTKPSSVRQLTYGEAYPCPEGNEERYKQVYLEHGAAVKAYFAERSCDFIVIDLEKGHGWPELGAFLGLKEIPTGPFVHSNKAEMRDTLPYRLAILRVRVLNRLRRMAGV